MPFALVTSAQQSGRDGDHRLTQSEGAVPSASQLHVQIEGGSIRLEGNSGDRISYLVRHSDPSNARNRSLPAPLYKLASYTRGSTSWLVATPQARESNLRSIELVVGVPHKVEFVELETSGGDVSVQGVTARVKVVTGGGHLQIHDAGGSVSAETGGQDIDVDSAQGDGRFRTDGGQISVRYIKGNIDAFTGGGSISLGTGMRNAVLESNAGDVHVTFCGGELKAQSGGGNLVLGDIGGPADISTNGGNLRLHSAKGFVRAHTTAGNIELGGVPGADASTEAGSIVATFTTSDGPSRDSTLQTSTGDITVLLPSDLHITVWASVDLRAGHTIRSEVPGIKIEQEGNGWSGSLFAEGKLNGGGPVLRVHATNGSITFRKL